MAMLQFVSSLLNWLPLPLALLAGGVIVIFTVVSLLRIVGLVLDALPFL